MDIIITTSKNFCFQSIATRFSRLLKNNMNTWKWRARIIFSISIYYYLYVVYALKSMHYTITVN